MYVQPPIDGLGVPSPGNKEKFWEIENSGFAGKYHGLPESAMGWYRRTTQIITPDGTERQVPIPRWLRFLSDIWSLLWVSWFMSYQKWYGLYLKFTNLLETVGLLPERATMNLRVTKSEVVGFLRGQEDRKFDLDEEHPIEDLIAVKLDLKPGDIFMTFGGSPTYIRDTGQTINFQGDGVDFLDGILMEEDFTMVTASYLVSRLDSRRGLPIEGQACEKYMREEEDK